MDIRKIIKEEVRKVFSENYPMGAQYDSSAPWNQVDKTREGDKAKEIKFEVIWYDYNSGFAILKDASGNKYIFNTDAVEMSEYEPYADREEEFEGYDEDGFPDVSYGEWTLEDYVIENYINDNLGGLTFGKGLDDYENGVSIAMMTPDLQEDVMSMVRYYQKKGKEKVAQSLAAAIDVPLEEGKMLDKIINQKTMDTPTGSIFFMNVSENKKK